MPSIQALKKLLQPRVTGGEVLPNLPKQTHRSILEVSGDSADETRAFKIKRAVALARQEKGQRFGNSATLEIAQWVVRN